MRWSGVRSRRRRICPETKRVPRQNGFMFRCRDATNIKGRERRKKARQSEKYQTTNISKYIELKVRMHENA